MPTDNPKAKSGGLMSKKVAGIPVPILVVGAGVTAFVIYKKLKGSSSSTSTDTTPATSTDTGSLNGEGSGYSGGGGGGYGGGGAGISSLAAAIQALTTELGSSSPTATSPTTSSTSTTTTTSTPVPSPVSSKPTLFSNPATAPANPGSTDIAAQTPQQALANTTPLGSNTSVFSAGRAASTEVPMSTPAKKTTNPPKPQTGAVAGKATQIRS